MTSATYIHIILYSCIHTYIAGSDTKMKRKKNAEVSYSILLHACIHTVHTYIHTFLYSTAQFYSMA